MSSLAISGDTSGTVTISAPAVAGTPTLTLPTTTGTILTTTGGVTPGTAGNILTSNGTALTSAAPAASGPVLKYVTDTTDITLVNVATSYVTVGSSFSVSIPTTGFINLRSFAGRLTYSSGLAETAMTLGIRIGTTNYWLGTTSVSGVSVYSVIYTATTAAGYDEYYGNPRSRNQGIYGIAGMISDITANSIPTGTQTVQLIAAANVAYAAGISILKGTTTTTRVGIEFVSAS